VGNLSNLSFPNGSCKAVLSFYADNADGTLLKQETVTVEPGQTATLSMSGLSYTGEIIGTVSFELETTLNVSSLQVFHVTTGTWPSV